MASAQSIIGYVPDAIAKELSQGKGLRGDTLELPLEPGKSAATLRVRHHDIEEVRVGPSSGGQTGLQLILKSEAKYEFVGTATSKEDSPIAIADPSFWYGLGRLRWFVIYAGPIYRPIDGQFRKMELKAT